MNSRFDEPERTDVYSARRRVRAGDAVLVCAYDGRRKFAAARLDGAIPFEELVARLSELPKETEIVLYCA